MISRLVRVIPRHRCYSTSSVTPRIAVVGAGPAGFYASQHILKHLPESRIDIYEALPVPYGLVRYGVAPDHPEVKNCISTFNKVGGHERVRFIGNTVLGCDVSLAELMSHYHAVLCTYGAAQERKLNIPGESRASGGLVSARDLVSLYNASPDQEVSQLQHCLNTDTVVIVGVGNVALDVARLILAPVDSIRHTDVSELWLEMRARSRVRRVIILGRRGPLHVSFTIKELRELLKLPGVTSVISEDDFTGVKEQLSKLERPRKRLTELLMKNLGNKTDSDSKSWELRLWRTPERIVVDDDGQVTGLECRHSQEREVSEMVECGLVVPSVGYSSLQADPLLPWDNQRSVVSNVDGRAGPGLYVAGWLGTGPRGVIIDTMNTAFRVAGHVVSDLSNQSLETKLGWAGLSNKLDHSTSWSDWEKLDAEEVRRGEVMGKPRVKVDNVKEMLGIIKS